MAERIPALLGHLRNNGVAIEIFASNWIFTLFTNSLPAESVPIFLDHFFEDGWLFFYRFTLTLLKILSSKILQSDSDDEILEVIKAPMITTVVTSTRFSENSQSSVNSRKQKRRFSLLSSISQLFSYEEERSY